MARNTRQAHCLPEYWPNNFRRKASALIDDTRKTGHIVNKFHHLPLIIVVCAADNVINVMISLIRV